MEAWRFGGLDKGREKLFKKRRTNRRHYGVLARLELEHRTHYGEITVFYIRKLLKRRSDFDYSSTMVIKHHSDFDCYKILTKFGQNWSRPGRLFATWKVSPHFLRAKMASKTPESFQNAILDPIIILASISDQSLIDFGPSFDQFLDVFGALLGCKFASSFHINFGQVLEWFSYQNSK